MPAPTLTWNEIRNRAMRFAKDWQNTTSESADAKSFWDAFFEVFGISRKRVASFEVPVKKGDESEGFIDLLWKGHLLVEHKSRGKNLDRAARQAFDYFPGIKEHELPKFVLVSDFARFRLYDMEDHAKQTEFSLADLYKNVDLFSFMAGYEVKTYEPGDPVNIRAAERLGRLHDLLLASGYEGHPLEVLLVRVLFCLFAEDNSLFERGQFREYLDLRTRDDGADTGMHLNMLFQCLNTPEEKRSKVLDELLNAFPYVNGRLFAETLPMPSFDSTMRDSLLEACSLDWAKISPAIFGSLFQSIMKADERRALGAHYTTETNILKALQPLFLDGLWDEFEKAKRSKDKLAALHKKIAGFKILDPACGCGNFLVIAYRELRRLELDILRELHKAASKDFLDISDIVRLDVDQFYGIELEEFPAQIAQVAMWLTDHQMNLQVSKEFGQYFQRLPLRKSATIVHGNALTIDWRQIVVPGQLSHIVGNPPFIGSKFMTPGQRNELLAVFNDTKNAGLLDYVSAWYRKAADFMSENNAIRAAFVSTNSITQGEQAGILWSDLQSRGVVRNFGHRTFQWSSEARGKAAVHCVIIGFSVRQSESRKLIYEYESVRSDPHLMVADNINPYLVDGPDIILPNRKHPICKVPYLSLGNQPIDGGHYLFTGEEKFDFLKLEPQSEPFFRRWVGSDEFINGTERWCLWLGDCAPDQLKRMPHCLERVKAVAKSRLSSKRPATQKLAETPTRFAFENMPRSRFLVIPEVSSERRQYIPIGYLGPDTFASNLVKVLPEAGLYEFGVLNSTMHNAWTRTVCGRMKSDYRYSTGIVYNNFPWPIDPTDKQIVQIEEAAQGILDARGEFPNSSLADLYDPLTMPPSLHKAHDRLDRAIDAAYGRRTYSSEASRVSFLFAMYQHITTGATLDL